MSPDTAKMLGIEHDKLMDQNISVLAASKYLDHLQKQYKLTPEQALAAYHTGPSGLTKNKTNAAAYTTGTDKWRVMLQPEVDSWKSPAPQPAPVMKQTPVVPVKPAKAPSKPVAALPVPEMQKTAALAFLQGYCK
jgi:hypothetical protein